MDTTVIVCLALALVFGGGVALGRWLASKKLLRQHRDAIYACEEMRKRLAFGSAILKLQRKDIGYHNDRHIDVIIAEGRPYALTCSVLPEAAARYERLVAKGELAPVNLPPH